MDEDVASEAGDEEATAQETGVVTIGGSKAIRAGKGVGKRDAEAMDEDEDAESPAVIDPTLVDLATVIDRADVLLCVMDARDPLAYRNTAIEEAGKPVVLVVTKTGAPPELCLYTCRSSPRTYRSCPQRSFVSMGISPTCIDNFAGCAVQGRLCFRSHCIGNDEVEAKT